jgi:hypothetical protein
VEPSAQPRSEAQGLAGPTRLTRRRALFAGHLAGSGLAFAAAVAAAIARSLQPFEHGWWLVAYLSLVGALSQAALVSGQGAIAAWQGRARAPVWLLRWELGLWNLGVVLVPVGVFAAVPAVLGLGSVALLAALALFVFGSCAPRAEQGQTARGWLYAYRALVMFLAGSVLVGTGLGEAYPWQ